MEKAIGISGALFLVVIICALVSRSRRDAVANWLSENPFRIWLFVFGLLGYNAFVSLLANAFRVEALMAQALYFFVPTAAIFSYSLTHPPNVKNGFVPLFVILSLWLPVEMRIMMKKMEIGGVGYPYVAACAVIYGMITLTMTSRHDLALDLVFPRVKNWLSRGACWLTAPLWLPVQSFLKNWRAIGGRVFFVGGVHDSADAVGRLHQAWN